MVTTTDATVTGLLDELVAGTKTVEQVAADFRTRTWPVRPAVTSDVADPEPLLEGSFDEVAAAFHARRITIEQYATLQQAASTKIQQQAAEGGSAKQGQEDEAG